MIFRTWTGKYTTLIMVIFRTWTPNFQWISQLATLPQDAFDLVEQGEAMEVLKDRTGPVSRVTGVDVPGWGIPGESPSGLNIFSEFQWHEWSSELVIPYNQWISESVKIVISHILRWVNQWKRTDAYSVWHLNSLGTFFFTKSRYWNKGEPESLFRFIEGHFFGVPSRVAIFQPRWSISLCCHLYI